MLLFLIDQPNAAMIACQGHYELMAREPNELSPDPNAASFLQMM